jgi:pyruvate kinase
MEQTKEYVEQLIKSLDDILITCTGLEEKFSGEIYATEPHFRKSARNLLHYLALRNRDMRNMQESLAELGLSSLGRSEGYVKNSLLAVRNNLARIYGIPEKIEQQGSLTLQQSKELLAAHTDSLLGARRDKRNVRIMVTLSRETAEDYEMIKELLIAGMDCARINCAHDDQEIWIRMIDHINRAKTETGLSCKILMDLAGLKLRTGPIVPGARVLRIKTKRDYLGKLIKPAKIWLGPPSIDTPAGVDVKIPVDGDWIRNLEPGDKISFQDTRGKKRQFEIVSREKDGCLAELFKRSYICTGTVLSLKDKKRNLEPIQVGLLPPVENFILLRKDDILILHKAPVPGENARYDENDLILALAHISCSNPEIFKNIKQGEPILFDDGKIEGVISSASPDMLLVKITHAKEGGSKLGEDKGINLPESSLGISGLMEKDYDDLKFIARHADIANISFVNEAQDLYQLQEELQRLKASHLGIMLKIETKRGFKNLPFLLLASMRSYPVGVMIARGDLAVECGWERLAEIQEEILWLCEAAHVPVVWATQVLESLAKKGSPSRAEITDAAMAQRADCVMLNKGPHIIQTIRMLSDILSRMEEHQHKKTAMLKNLKVSEVFDLKER